MTTSPTLEGFRAIFRRPSLGLAEIAWRWSIGFAASLLLIFSILTYLNTLPVTAAELLLLRTGQPVFILKALARIFNGTGPRLVVAIAITMLALTLAWTFAATASRLAIVQALLDYLQNLSAQRRERKLPFAQAPHSGRPFRTLFVLNCLRVILAAAACVGTVGALLLAGFASSDANPAPGSAVLIFLMLFLLVWLAWSAVNWLLSLAAVFAVADRCDTFTAIGAAMHLCVVRAGAVAAAGAWFGGAHLIAFLVASSVVAFPLALTGVLPNGVVVGGVLFTTLLYFAAVDFLYTGRLAAYAAIVEFPPAPAAPMFRASPLPTMDHRQLLLDLTSRVDADELILSDLPRRPEDI